MSDLSWLTERSEADPETGCWVWKLSLRNGYGQARVQGRVVYAHRMAWEIVNGPIPKDLVVDHVCFRPACVNPDHLQLLTNADNVRRRQMVVQGVWRCGHQREGNTYERPSGVRQCLRCSREKALTYYHRNKKESA